MACLSSCGVYRTSFDCPPGKGVGCAPVGEVLDLIVEREEGEDLFVEDLDVAFLLRQQENEDREEQRKKTPKISYLIRDEQGNLKIVFSPARGKS